MHAHFFKKKCKSQFRYFGILDTKNIFVNRHSRHVLVMLIFSLLFFSVLQTELLKVQQKQKWRKKKRWKDATSMLKEESSSAFLHGVIYLSSCTELNNIKDTRWWRLKIIRFPLKLIWGITAFTVFTKTPSLPSEWISSIQTGISGLIKWSHEF